MGQINPEQKTKVCSKCGDEKSVDDFHKSSNYRDGYTGQCKKCRNAKIMEYHRNNPEKLLESYKKYHSTENGKEHARKHNKTRRENGKQPAYMEVYRKEKAAAIAYTAWKYKLKDYGINEEDYNAMLKEQCGVCALCHKEDPQGIRLAIDHNHATGKVRALLCGLCNKMIGLAQEKPTVLQRAASYLLTHAAA